MGFINKIFGTHSQHELKRIKPIVDKILGMLQFVRPPEECWARSIIRFS